MALRRLSLTRGDTHTYTVTFTDDDGAPVCIKDWTVYMTLKTHWSLPDAAISLQKTVTAFSDSTSGTTGIAEISLTPGDTKNLDVREYDFDIKGITQGGDTYTAMRGRFALEYNVAGTSGTHGG